MIEGNLIIKASAGTGKTFSLATRFIRLMLFGEVRPERIIALTFSRAAAQEIYTKILERLWEAADGDPQEEALKEKGFLLEGITLPAGKTYDFSRGRFARLLRGLINTQHQGAIATLDSFILKIVGNFPLELGFQNAVEVLDGIGEQDALDAAIDGMLVDGKVAAAVAKNFREMNGGTFSRTCLKDIGEVLNRQGWRNFALSNPGCENWSVASMAQALGVDVDSKCPDLSSVTVNGDRNPEASFIKLAHKYDGKKSFLPDKGKHLDLIEFFWTHPGEDAYTYEFYRREYTVKGGAAIRAAIKHMMDLYLVRQLKIVEAKLRLVKLIDDEYHRRTRRMGKLTFQDFTDYSAKKEGTDEALALENVEFRFDSKFEHWALDEFQDTSEVQWQCLHRLVRSAAGGEGGRTVLAVGDQKQSIYTWRGASKAPFEELLGWGEFQEPMGKVTSIDASHRYGRNTADFVNAVFGSANGLIRCPEWSEAWPMHSAGAANDYVKVVAAAPDADPDSDDEILPALYRELKAIWTEHCRVKSGESVGVLVRGNDKGAAVADYLRARGLPVVWEGMNRVHDLPAVQGVLCLLQLAAHPEDTFAWKTVKVLLPKVGALLPECDTAEKMSAKVCEMLAQLGLSRTVKEFANGLADPAQGLDGLSRERLAALVRLAVDYEGRPSADGGVDGFVRFLENSEKRELGVSSDVIRILTIHRSKGLTLDRVLVPLFECKGDGGVKDGRYAAAIDRPKMSAPLFVKGEAWVLHHLPKGLEAFNAHTRSAHETMCRERLLENLRTYYVALTRGRKATYVIFPRDSNADPGKGLLVRDLVAGACKDFTPCALVADGVEYGTTVYEAGVVPAMAPRKDAVPERGEWKLGKGTPAPRRVTPSGEIHKEGGEFAVAPLFAADYGAAAEHGVEVHAKFASIEWATEAELQAMPAAFRPAFAKPSENATVWRERAYELFVGNRWETGQFDRVVFDGQGEGRTAVIYDFKTNLRRENESPERFARRMQETYSGQMTAYRHALAALTEIPLEHIRAELLLEATGEGSEVQVSSSSRRTKR